MELPTCVDDENRLVQAENGSTETVARASMLMISLIETCVNTNPATAHLSDEEKRQTFLSMTQQLQDASILPSQVADLAKEKYSEHRDEYQKGLSLLIDQNVKMVHGAKADEDYKEPDLKLDLKLDEIAMLPTMFSTDLFAPKPVPHILPGTKIPLTSGTYDANTSRYKREFEQLDFLGKGGFGSVWSCQHSLDNQLYAVKEIVINKALQALTAEKARDFSDTRKIFNEIRTLARLDHCNVVRYYASWIEALPTEIYAKRTRHTDETSSSRSSETESSLNAYSVDNMTHKLDGLSVSEKSNPSQEFRRLETIYDDEDDEYESDDIAVEVVGEVSSQSHSAFDHDNKAFNKSIKEEYSDIFERSLAVPESVRSTKSNQKGKPQKSDKSNYIYILYIQMSLHPLSLATYLQPAAGDTGQMVIHNFNPITSTKLMLKLIDAAEYLHKSKLIHRDLKPANIFLSIEEADEGNHGGVQCGGCCCSDRAKECDLKFGPGSCLPGVKRWIIPKIGDFGLVKEVDTEKVEDIKSSSNSMMENKPRRDKTAGTLFYRYVTPSYLLQLYYIMIAPYYMFLSLRFVLQCKAKETLADNYSPPRTEDDRESDPLNTTNTSINTPCEKTDIFALGVIYFELLYKFSTGSERCRVLDQLTNRKLYNVQDNSFYPKDFMISSPSGMVEKIQDIITGMTFPKRLGRWDMSKARKMMKNVLDHNQT